MTLAPWSANDGIWTDYDDQSVYGDHTVDGFGAASEAMGYLPGMWQNDLAGGSEAFVHGDRIGSSRMMTASSQSIARRVVFTAFGEPVFESGLIDSRYQYAGAWGYQTTEALPFLHVGERFYDPALGRFLQRDSVGPREAWLAGSLRQYLSYGYAANNPLIFIDASGRWALVAFVVLKAVIWVARAVVPKLVVRAVKNRRVQAFILGVCVNFNRCRGGGYGKPPPPVPPPGFRDSGS